MERILIVEDNKTLAKLIAKKLQTALPFEVDVVFNMAEAKLFLQRYTYFVTLLDINLPDAPNGEIIDYVLSKGQHVIVLSGNIDKNFRKKILQKNIIDYVNKSGIEDINYIIQSIQRLQNNKTHKILVVDDSVVVRKMMSTLLENLFFTVYTVAHGEEALGMLKTHPDISLMITDYNMPVMNGLELVKETRKIFSKNDLCIIAISVHDDEEMNALFLKQGANDFIKKPFSKEEFSCRINNSIEALENLHALTNYANRDYLTGLYNRRYFYEHMSEYMAEAKESAEHFTVAVVDIDYFKKINDSYGHDTGDKVIVNLADILRSNLKHNDIIARFGGEEFCLVFKNKNMSQTIPVVERLRAEVQNTNIKIDAHTTITISISIGLASHNSEDGLEESINQADMMLYKAKQEGRNRVVYE
ncbi:MAG: diguanylate cyclase [Sulfurimonas sp.]|nr:diguanylate cyclase [Sulfurimonas sp.]MBU3940106.1 diguanylate cyclase [bacterium]MBU4025531.1 diguanylate cyclase [bacterium]MBU4060087.1 diguanylate cyclase [bacterium]MBU4110256.1 diguanylate cyclase [bacterium]